MTTTQKDENPSEMLCVYAQMGMEMSRCSRAKANEEKPGSYGPLKPIIVYVPVVGKEGEFKVYRIQEGHYYGPDDERFHGTPPKGTFILNMEEQK